MNKQEEQQLEALEAAVATLTKAVEETTSALEFDNTQLREAMEYAAGVLEEDWPEVETAAKVLRKALAGESWKVLQ